MGECYHDEATFTDEAFVNLNAQEVRAMWQMLCVRAKDFRLEFSQIKAEDNIGSAHWEAWYLFSQSGNKVHNIIDAAFEFKDGKISKHRDSFDFHRWAGQALGLTGKLLGWTSFLKNKVQTTARRGLDKFMAG
ncbi:MAG: nuclear transport factor 2 family protein [Spirosomaceae bacterium]|nr:nuclear transport factor 2 family protein [Spirosomataceae bacterium]